MSSNIGARLSDVTTQSGVQRGQVVAVSGGVASIAVGGQIKQVAGAGLKVGGQIILDGEQIKIDWSGGAGVVEYDV